MKNRKAEEATMTTTTFDEKINKVTCQAILAQIKEDDDGEKHSSWTVQAALVEFCGSKAETDSAPKKKTYKK